MSRRSEPRHNPLACGALGDYDPGLVRRIGEGIGAGLSVAHEDGSSILLLDRAPIRWRGRGRGFAWSESRSRDRTVRFWKDAAVELAACGLVVQNERRRVHSSVSGIAPVYHVELDGAVYFASRIDALAMALPMRLTIDWRAWASIFFLRFPLGERTPFGEVKRLRPFSTLEWDEGGERRRTVEHRWPWAEFEPDLDLEDGSDACVEAMRDAIAPLEASPVTCTLSGGRDSRLLLCLLAEREQDVRALTVSPDNGHDREESIAAAVAGALGVRHSTVEGGVERVLDRHARARIARRLPTRGSTLGDAALRRPQGVFGAATDGLALDTLAQAGDTYYSESMIRPDGTPAIAQALWTRLLGQVMRHATRRVLSPEIDDELKSLARRQFMAEANRFRGHPAEVVLTFYATRTVRGISLTPNAVLGTDLTTVTPGTEHQVAAALLRTRPSEKFGARIYRALFERVNRAVGELPSSHDRPAPPVIARSRRGSPTPPSAGTSRCSPRAPRARAERRGQGASRGRDARRGTCGPDAPPRGARGHPPTPLARALSGPARRRAIRWTSSSRPPPGVRARRSRG